MYGFRKKDFLNFKIIETVMEVRLAPSNLNCGAFCIELNGCMSWSYNNITNDCYLWDVEYYNLTSVTASPEIGWSYFTTNKGLLF